MDTKNIWLIWSQILYLQIWEEGLPGISRIFQGFIIYWICLLNMIIQLYIEKYNIDKKC